MSVASYFVMRNAFDFEVPPVQGYMEIEDWVGIEGFEDWGSGELARRHPTGSVVIDAVPHEGYVGLPSDIQDNEVPLMSARLKEAIESAGVDNINFLPVTLRNPETGQTYEYYAFNLMGLVSAVDLGKSRMGSLDGDFAGDSQIYDLVVDESKTRGLLMFRLKEKLSAILVHRKVKESVERRGVSTLRFVEPEDYMAL